MTNAQAALAASVQFNMPPITNSRNGGVSYGSQQYPSTITQSAQMFLEWLNNQDAEAAKLATVRDKGTLEERVERLEAGNV